MKLSVNLDAPIEFIDVPGTQEQVIIIDDFLIDPEPVLEFAHKHAYFHQVGADGTFYPGRREQMPAPYIRALESLLNRDNYPFTCGLGPQAVSRAMLSLITLNADQLSDVQRMPHIDSSDNLAFASVHYLSQSPRGGTAIYRHKSSGTVQVTAQNQAVVHQMIADVKSNQAQHTGYISGDTDVFEVVVNIPEKFNRLVIYKSNLLHSAQLSHPNSTKDCARDGRLTVASFFRPIDC